MKNQSLHLFLLGGFSLLLLLSFCFTFQGFKQNSEAAESSILNDTEMHSVELNELDTVRFYDNSCVEYTRHDRSDCGNDSVKSLNKTVVKVSPVHGPSCKSVESELDNSFGSSALNITLDSYTLERHINPCPDKSCKEGLILTVESFSAMIERIRQESFGPNAIGEPSAAQSESENHEQYRMNLLERVRKARETV